MNAVSFRDEMYSGCIFLRARLHSFVLIQHHLSAFHKLCVHRYAWTWSKKLVDRGNIDKFMTKLEVDRRKLELISASNQDCRVTNAFSPRYLPLRRRGIMIIAQSRLHVSTQNTLLHVLYSNNPSGSYKMRRSSTIDRSLIL